jgi:hypothetical protein
MIKPNSIHLPKKWLVMGKITNVVKYTFRQNL